MTTTSNPLLTLVQPIGGLISGHTQLISAPGDPRFATTIARLGNVAKVLPGFSGPTSSSDKKTNLDGAGGGLTEEDGIIRSTAEALERYASCLYDERQFIWATPDELGKEALDLDTIPVCSASELNHSKCPLQLPDKSQPIRWVRGLSLLDGRLVWIPAVMVYLHMPLATQAERFWLPISTGCAAHTSMDRALVSAICEVVERDAVSLTWLQKIPWPRIEMDVCPEWLQPYLQRQQRSIGVEHYLFDATSDLGIPTVYSVQVARNNEKLAVLVMCSTELDPAVAVAKVLRESASSRLAMHMAATPPDNWDDFGDVSHGASYMGQKERLPEYEFLLGSAARRPLSRIEPFSLGNPSKDLAKLLSVFRERHIDVFAVDLTTDEAIRAGMRVVRTIVPALQPLSFSCRARYLGHPRLYNAPLKMGYTSHSEADINPWPQPFA